MSRKRIYHFSRVSWLLSVVFLLLACHEPVSESRIPPSPEPQLAHASQAQDTSEREDQFLEFLVKEKLNWMAEAWRQFTKTDRYRIAQPKDFDPVAREEMQYPYERTAISHEQGFDDFAVVVVDKTRSDSNRFGLVVFNSPNDGKTSPEPIWVYRDSDLSRTIMRKWSGGIILSKYSDGGSQDNCYLNWNKSRRTYSCDKDYDGSHVGLPKSRFRRLK